MSWLLLHAEALRNLALIVGGAIGIWLAWLRVAAANEQARAQTRQAEVAARQAELGQRKLIAELFSQAVGQLRDEKVEIRLFAIYSLRQIFDDYPDYRRPVLELLTAYLRALPAPQDADAEAAADVSEILRLIREKSE